MPCCWWLHDSRAGALPQRRHHCHGGRPHTFALRGQARPGRLLGDEFTLRELRLAHEAVAGKTLQHDAFRRTMEPQLVATGATTTGTRGRPAELFRRLEDPDATRLPKR
jgi:hypothetical protein